MHLIICRTPYLICLFEDSYICVCIFIVIIEIIEIVERMVLAFVYKKKNYKTKRIVL